MYVDKKDSMSDVDKRVVVDCQPLQPRTWGMGRLSCYGLPILMLLLFSL